MAKSAAQYEKDLLDTIVEKTGKSLNDWMNVISAEQLSKNKEITKFLKKTHHLNHAHASNLGAIFLNNGKPVHGDPSELLNQLFVGKETQKPLYELILSKLISNIKEANVTPRKTYVQLDNKKTFAVIKINKSNIRLGLDLGDQSFSGSVEKAKSLGAMPRFSHMIEFKELEDVKDNIVTFVQDSLERNS